MQHKIVISLPLGFTLVHKQVNGLFIFIQVMIQPQNRQISFSLYISALAVADTVVLLAGKLVVFSRISTAKQNRRDNCGFS